MLDLYLGRPIWRSLGVAWGLAGLSTTLAAQPVEAGPRVVAAALPVQAAASPSHAVFEGLLTQVIEDRIEDAAKRRDPVTAFVKIGVGSIDKIVRTVEAASSKVNTIMLVIGGLILGGMMLGFMQTTMEIQTAIKPV